MLRRIGITLIALVLVGVGVIFLWARTAARPANLGVTDGQLAACPDSPNCVTTQQGNAEQRMEPISFTASEDAARAQIVRIVQEMERSEIVVNDPAYVAAVFRSPTIGFPDDTEFYFDDANKVIHFRSAARLGYSDMDANRQRMEEIRRRFVATQ